MGCSGSKNKKKTNAGGAEGEGGNDWQDQVQHRNLQEPSLRKVDDDLYKDTNKEIGVHNAREESDI